MTKLVATTEARFSLVIESDAKITGILGLTSGEVPSDRVKIASDLLMLRLDAETAQTARPAVLRTDVLTIGLAVESARRLPIVASDTLTVILADNVVKRTLTANDLLRVICIDGVQARPILASDVLTVQLIEAPIAAAIYRGDDPLTVLATDSGNRSSVVAGATIQDEAGGTITDESGGPVEEG